MLSSPSRSQNPRDFFSSELSLRRVRRLPGRTALTLALCFGLAVAPVTASAEPMTGVRAMAAACVLFLSQLAGAQDVKPPEAAKPAEVKKADEVAKEIERARQAEIDAKKDELNGGAKPAEPAKGSGWGVIAENLGKPFQQRTEVYLAMVAAGAFIGLTGRLLWARARGHAALSDAVMARRKDILTEERTAYDAAKNEFAEAERVYYEAVEREAVADQNGRAAYLERVKAQVTGPAKDRLIALLEAAKREPGPAGPDARPASVPEGPSVDQAFQTLLAKYTKLCEVYGKIRQRLLDNGVKSEELPEMDDAVKLLDGLDEQMRLVAGFDRSTMQSKTVEEALKKLEETTSKFINDGVPQSRRPWMAVAAPAITVAWAIAPAYWPVYLAAGATAFALWGANVRARWRATILATILVVIPTTGYLTHLYFKSQNAKVEVAETARGDRAIQDRPLGEWPTMRYRDLEYLAQSFVEAWNKVPELEGVPAPVKPSGNPAAPNPMSDAIQKVLNDAKADLVAKFGEEGAKAHLVELYELVARAFASQSKEFRNLTQPEQDAIVKFLAKQMVAHPHRIPQPPPAR